MPQQNFTHTHYVLINKNNRDMHYAFTTHIMIKINIMVN